MDRDELLNLYDRIIASEIEKILGFCDRAAQHGYKELVVIDGWLTEKDMAIFTIINITNTFLKEGFNIEIGTTRRRMKGLKRYWLAKVSGRFPLKRYKKKLDVDVNPFRYVSMIELLKNDLLTQNQIEWQDIFQEYYLKK